MKRWLRFAVLVCVVGTVPLLLGIAKQFARPDAQITFCASGCTNAMTMDNIAGGAGQVGARFDKDALGLNGASGARAMPDRWKWRCNFALTGTPVVDTVIELWVATSDGTNADGTIGTTNAALSGAALNKRKAMIYAGNLIVYDTNSNTVMTASGMVTIPDRYFSPVMFNATALPTQNSANVNKCWFQPLYPEME
jgi:hypothetical protein